MRFCDGDGCTDVAKTGNFCAVCAAKQQPAKSKRHPRDAWYQRAAWRGPYGVRRWFIKYHTVCEFIEADGTACTAKSEDVHHTIGWKDVEDEHAAWLIFLGGIQGEFFQALCHRHHAAITMKEMIFGPNQKESR